VHVIFSITLSSVSNVLLAIIGFGALVLLMIFGVNFLFRKLSGWAAITGRFPVIGDPEAGDTYPRQSGNIGSVQCNRGFNIHLTQRGIFLYPSFARKIPCFIPWSALRRVSVNATGLLVVVDYEKSFEFFLPAEALPTLQPHLSGQLIHKGGDPFEAAKAALNDGTHSKLMTTIAGGAIKLAEKEYEKEKPLWEKHSDDAT
jgi:hypothetical protein